MEKEERERGRYQVKHLSEPKTEFRLGSLRMLPHLGSVERLAKILMDTGLVLDGKVCINPSTTPLKFLKNIKSCKKTSTHLSFSLRQTGKTVAHRNSDPIPPFPSVSVCTQRHQKKVVCEEEQHKKVINEPNEKKSTSAV